MGNGTQAPPYQPPVGVPHTFAHTFPASADQVGQARRLLAAFLASFPRADDVVLICSELATNAILHSKSGEPGGHFTVRARHHLGFIAFLEVTDQGGPWIGDTRTFRTAHGLSIVDRLADRWEICGDDSGRTIRVVVEAAPGHQAGLR
jgi:anti-sigma regulatory factor (Ser/Thr protein kinase)